MKLDRLVRFAKAITPGMMLTAALPYLGQAAALAVNGTCVTGGTSCSSPTSISSGSITGTIPYTLTLADGDIYNISVPYSASYGAGGSTITVTPSVTYAGSTPSAAADTIALNFYQNYFDNSPGTFDGTYGETVTLLVGANSTESGQLFIDGQGLPLVGPYGPGSYSISKSAALTGLTGDVLAYNYQFNYAFAAGTLPGTTSSSPAPSVPEPNEAIPAAIALGGLALVCLRRRER